jgi:hypothetical protein
MTPEEIAAANGQTGSDRIAAYKLNEIKLNGNTGTFILRQTLAEKGEDGRYPTKELGPKIGGVILKMRWRLARFEKNKASILSSEFDNKSTDTVVLFGSNEKGIAAALKDKYELGSQRVLYTYIPAIKEVVRIIVKPSALSGDKNLEGQLGLFEYVDGFNQDKKYLHEWMTEFSTVKRTEPVEYFAMTFRAHKEIEAENKQPMVDLFKEVHEKTNGSAFAEHYAGTDGDGKGAPANIAGEYPEEDINPDDIPF